MNIDKISVGHNAPWDVNAIIEISKIDFASLVGGPPVAQQATDHADT